MDNSSFLRKALLGNAAFSTLCGLDLLFAPAAVDRLIGLGNPAELRGLGIQLLVFALALVIAATRRRLRAWVAGLFTTLDVAWVAGTAVLLVARPDVLSGTGNLVAFLVADAVAVFAVLQIVGIRRLTHGGRERHDGGALESPLRAS